MNYIALLIQYGPLVLSTVKSIETALPDSSGKQKFDAALTLITSVSEELAKAAPALTQLINGVVAAYNSAGVFTKKTPAAA